MMVSPIASKQQRVCGGGARVWRRIRSATMRLAVLALMAFAIAAPATAGCDDDDRPATPFSLEAHPLSSTSIIFEWSSNVGHYDIYIRDKWGRPVREAPDIVGGATYENYHEFYGLQPDKEYFFSMRARTEGGTQGCISKNVSETVSAKTDTADMNKSCVSYARTVMKQIQEMNKRQCQLPGNNPYEGNWATKERIHFEYCLGQKRAGLQGDAHADWLRNQDLYACREHAKKCKRYRDFAVHEAMENAMFHCGYRGARWTFNGSAHYSWCMGLSADSSLPVREKMARVHRLRFCMAKRASSTQGSGGNTSACTGAPAEWAAMLKAHNDLRAQYCGAPLTWNCDLAAQAQSYADKCILDQHGASGENMADEWSSDDKYPAATDAKAFDDVWGCEKDEFHFDHPEIVGGFKEDCHKGRNGQKPVNGHFTQIVWGSNTMLGCGRAKCAMKDSNGKIHQGTHWVCRYLPGGNNPGTLAENVRKPPCANAFHSLPVPVPTCFGGMVLTGSGNCQCPPGQRWRGRRCSEDRVSSSPPPVGTETCPRSRPVGSPPNCCPEGTIFENGVCRVTRSTSSSVCPSDRPNGTYPNCCPVGTEYRSGMCRRPVGHGGTNGTMPGRQGRTPVCPRSRPVGHYPNCCPRGMEYRSGMCRRPAGNGGTNGTMPSHHRPPKHRPPHRPPHRPRPTSTPTAPTPNPVPQKPKCTGGKVATPSGQCVCPSGMQDKGHGRCDIIVR
jgi:hypothetical protein